MLIKNLFVNPKWVTSEWLANCCKLGATGWQNNINFFNPSQHQTKTIYLHQFRQTQTFFAITRTEIMSKHTRALIVCPLRSCSVISLDFKTPSLIYQLWMLPSCHSIWDWSIGMCLISFRVGHAHKMSYIFF